MASYFLYMIVSFLGFLILIIINSKYREVSSVNIFLQIPIGIIASRNFFHAISVFYQTPFTHTVINGLDILGTMSIVCFYLYIRGLVLKSNELKSNYFHFFSPLLLMFIFLLIQFVDEQYKPLVRMTYAASAGMIAIFYCILTFKILHKHVWNRPKGILGFAEQDQVIYRWAVFLYICSCLLVLSFLFRIILYNFYDVIKSQSSSLLVSSTIWVGLLIKILVYYIMELPQTEKIRVLSTLYTVEILTIEMADLVVQIDKVKENISAAIVQIQTDRSVVVDLQTKLMLLYVKETGKLPPT